MYDTTVETKGYGQGQSHCLSTFCGVVLQFCYKMRQEKISLAKKNSSVERIYNINKFLKILFF